MDRRRGDVGGIGAGLLGGFGSVGPGVKVSLALVFVVDGIGSGDGGVAVGGTGAVVGGGMLRARSCCSS